MSYRFFSSLFFVADRGTYGAGTGFIRSPLFAPIQGRIHVLNLLARIVKCNAPLAAGVGAALAANPPQNAKKILRRLHDDLNQGHDLIAALAQQPRSFSKPELALLAAGEASGNLGQTLHEIEQHLRDKVKWDAALLQILSYFFVVVLIGSGTLQIMSRGVHEAYMEAYTAFGVTPQAGGFLYAASKWLRDHQAWFSYFSPLIWALVLSLPGILFFWVTLNGNSRLARAAASVILRVPVLRVFVKAFSTAHAADILAQLAGAGFPLDEALGYAAEGAHPAYAAALLRMRDRVRQGSSFGQAAEYETRLFPSSFAEMAALGDYAGNLPETLANLAHVYRERAGRLVGVAEAVAAPLSTIALGVVVFAVAYCCYGLTVMCSTIIMESM